MFSVDPSSGIISPARAAAGGSQHRVRVAAADGAHADAAAVDITVLSVNKHAPQFVLPDSGVKVLEVDEVRFVYVSPMEPLNSIFSRFTDFLPT